MLVKRIITSSGKVRWLARVKYFTQDRRKRFRVRAEAIRWTVLITRELATESADAFTQFNCRTFGDLLDRYRDEELPRLRQSSQTQISSSLRKWQIYISKATILSEVTAERLLAVKGLWVNFKPTHVNSLLTRLSRVLALGVQWGWLPTNPMQRVRRVTVGFRPFRVLTEAERQRLRFYARLSPCPVLLPLIIVALATGPRKTELRKLTWDDYDPHNNRLYLRETKNGEPRALPLYGEARRVVAELFRTRQPRAKYIFPGKKGGPVAVDYYWGKIRDKAGLDGFRFHDLRHSCASFLAMEGATTQEIAEVLGHKTLTMVKRYAHLTRGHTDSAVERMNLQRLG